MKKFYITLLILLFSLIPFCLSGCGCIPKNIRANMITKYMENKYTDDHFELKRWRGCGGAGGFPPNTEAYYASEKCPYKDIRAVYVADTNKYYDNYLGIKYAGQLDEYVDSLAKELFPDSKTKHASYSENTINAMLLDLPSDTTFDDYLKNCNEVVYMYCEYDSNELEKHRNSIKNKAEETLPNKDMRFGVVDFNFTNNIDNGDVYSYLHISFDGTKNNEIKTIEWRK